MVPCPQWAESESNIAQLKKKGSINHTYLNCQLRVISEFEHFKHIYEISGNLTLNFKKFNGETESRWEGLWFLECVANLDLKKK